MTVQAELPSVRGLLSVVKGELRGVLDQQRMHSIELVLAEVLNNIVEHAYSGRDPGPVHLEMKREKGFLSCVIEDDGAPMPGLELPAGAWPEMGPSTQKLPEGGWGWLMIRALTQQLTYERRGQRNRLSFSFPS